MKGACLCGKVRFEILGEVPNLYQCHCSECRKATGTSANAAHDEGNGRYPRQQ